MLGTLLGVKQRSRRRRRAAGGGAGFPRHSGHHADLLTYFLLPMVFGVEIPGNHHRGVCAGADRSSAYLPCGEGRHRRDAPRQWQAGLSLGLTCWQTLRMIVLPQALRMMVPSFINQWISLIKDTSLAYIVGVGELTFWRPGSTTTTWSTRWKCSCSWRWSISCSARRSICWPTRLTAASARKPAR